MNYYELWSKTRGDHCYCDWCEGHFMALNKDPNGNWLWDQCVWSKKCVQENIGDPLTEANAMCWHIKLTSAPKAKIIKPVYCKSCNLYNEYAESNQKDGSYLCFNCR